MNGKCQRKLLLMFEYPSMNGGENSLLAMLDGIRRFSGDESRSAFGPIDGDVIDGDVKSSELRALARQWRVSAVAPAVGPLAGELAKRGINVFPLPWAHQGAEPRPSLTEKRTALKQLIQQHQPDIVHANSLSITRIVGPVVRDLEQPCLGHIRDIVRLNRTAINDVAGVTLLATVSNATRDWHIQQGLPAQQAMTLYNGIDVQRFRPVEPTGYLHRQLDLAKDSQLIGSIGQIGMRKGLDALLDAAEIVVGENDKANFLIVGQRHSGKDEAVEYERRLLDRAAREPLRGRLHFLGRRTDVPELLNELSLLMHMARQEPLGRVLLEAGACGVPVVATDVGGTREIFATEGSACLVEKDDASSAAAEALKILSDVPWAESLGLAVRKRIVGHFGRARASANLLRIYDRVMV